MDYLLKIFCISACFSLAYSAATATTTTTTTTSTTLPPPLPIRTKNADLKIIDHDNFVYYEDLGIWYKFHKTPLSWGNARLFCKSEKATLAIPKNTAEVNALKTIFEDYPANTLVGAAFSDLVLLGFHDHFTEYDFMTESGFSLDYFYRIFENGQPNQGRTANCGAMNRFGHYYDYTCAKLGVFICQKEDNPYQNQLIATVHSNVLDPAYKVNPNTGKKYKIHTDIRPWDIARSICFSEGSNLAVIRSREDAEFLTDMINDPKNFVKYSPLKNYAYIGLHDYFIESWFVTVTGENLEELNYTNWAVNEPTGGDKENCVVLNSNGQMYDTACTNNAIYICEMSSNDLTPR